MVRGGGSSHRRNVVGRQRVRSEAGGRITHTARAWLTLWLFPFVKQFARLSQPDLLVDCRLIAPGDENSLSPEEIESLSSPNADAQRASGAARFVARDLLAQLGAAQGALLKGWTGAPLWPEGFTGSLAHDSTVAAAAVGRLRAVRGIGLDVELAEPLAADMIELVLTPAERQRIGDDAMQAKLRSSPRKRSTRRFTRSMAASWNITTSASTCRASAR